MIAFQLWRKGWCKIRIRNLNVPTWSTGKCQSGPRPIHTGNFNQVREIGKYEPSLAAGYSGEMATC